MKIYGRHLMIRVNGHTIALATSCSMETTAATFDARTKRDTGARDVVSNITWSMRSTSCVGYNADTTQETYTSLLRAHLTGATVQAEFILAAKDVSGLVTSDWQLSNTTDFVPVAGTAIIKSIAVNAEVNGYASFNVELMGQGLLKTIEE